MNGRNACRLKESKCCVVMEATNIDKMLEYVREIESMQSSTCYERDEIGERFNVFSLCGVNHYELWHSRILAEFLNPQGTHGFSDVGLLKSFFAMVSRKCPEKSCVFDSFDKTTIVRTELPEKIDNKSIGRFDIYLENWQNKAICIIENKIFAGEQFEQLVCYAKWLGEKEKEGYKTCLVFLTLDGHESVTAKNDVEYIRLAYLDTGKGSDVISWLHECCQLARNKPFVRETLAQYEQHVKNIINGGDAMKNKVTEYLQMNYSLLGVAQDIYEAYCPARNSYAKQLFDKFKEWVKNWRGGDLNPKALKYGFDPAHKECGYLWTMEVFNRDFDIDIFIGFEETDLRGFFIGVCKDYLPEELRSVDAKKWSVKCDVDKLKWDAPNQWWPMWRYVGQCENYPNWDGRFLADVLSDENRRVYYFEEMAETLLVIKETFEELIAQSLNDR